MARADLTRVTILDWIVVGAGLLAYISSFLPWYRADVSVLGIEQSATANAWNAGIGAWLPVLLLVVAGVVVLASTTGVRLPASKSLITLGLSMLAVIAILLRWMTFPDATGRRTLDMDNVNVEGLLAVSSGADVGLYIGLIAAIAAVVASFLTSRAAGAILS
jgi:energy-coupling factor transporter transmembrane protein EcfT